MKKSIICLIAALGLLASCDPTQSEKDFAAVNPSAEALADAVTFTQYSKTDSVTPQVNGNWIVYNTNPQQIVSIVSIDATGGERVLDYGKTHGAFMLSPSRGSSPEQTIIIRVINSYGQNVDAKKSLTVEVPTELAPEMKVLCGESGKKVWKWNTNASNGRVWGNMGSDGTTSGKDFALNGGEWWGVTSEAEFMDQLNHTNDGKAHGDESMDATMVISEDGTITCYNAEGKVIRSGNFSVQNYDPEYKLSVHQCGTLHTDAGTILFPYEINSGGKMPTDFEIAYMSPTRLVLTYPDGGTWSSNWSEGTFWQFTSADDLSGVLTDFDEATWTWDTDNGPWGICGYGSMAYGGYSSLTGNTWWVVDNGLDEQITNYKYGFADNEKATMTFKKDGTFTKSTGGKGTFEFNAKKTLDLGGYGEGKTWGRLTVTGDGLLLPVLVNAGTTANEYDVVYFDDNHLVLCCPRYPKGTKNGDDDAASWMEGTFWRFKKATSTSNAARKR